MYSPAIQGLLVQARIEELHRAARTSNRRRAAAPASDVNRPDAVPLSTLVKRALGRVFDGGPARSDDAAAIHGAQHVGPSPATTRSRS